jgi:hypothetical protein
MACNSLQAAVEHAVVSAISQLLWLDLLDYDRLRGASFINLAACRYLVPGKREKLGVLSTRWRGIGDRPEDDAVVGKNNQLRPRICTRCRALLADRLAQPFGERAGGIQNVTLDCYRRSVSSVHTHRHGKQNKSENFCNTQREFHDLCLLFGLSPRNLGVFHREPVSARFPQRPADETRARTRLISHLALPIDFVETGWPASVEAILLVESDLELALQGYALPLNNKIFADAMAEESVHPAVTTIVIKSVGSLSDRSKAVHAVSRLPPKAYRSSDFNIALGASDFAPQFLEMARNTGNPLGPSALIALGDLHEAKALEISRAGFTSRNPERLAASARAAGNLVALPGVSAGDVRDQLAILLADRGAWQPARLAALNSLLALNDPRLDSALALAVRDAGFESTDLLNKIEEQLYNRKVTLTLP